MRKTYRRPAKGHRDANHVELVNVLNALGFLVIDLSAVGGGVPDLLVGRRGVISLCEIKNPDGTNGAVKAGGGFTEQQRNFIDLWNSQARVTVHVVTSLNDVVALAGKLP